MCGVSCLKVLFSTHHGARAGQTPRHATPLEEQQLKGGARAEGPSGVSERKGRRHAPQSARGTDIPAHVRTMGHNNHSKAGQARLHSETRQRSIVCNPWHKLLPHAENAQTPPAMGVAEDCYHLCHASIFRVHV